MSGHTRGCGANCRCGFDSPPCRVCNCGADTGTAGLTPEAFVAAVAEGRSRPVGLPDGRIGLRILPQPPREFVARVWHDLTIAAARALQEVGA